MADQGTQSEQQLVVFDLGSESYGVDICSVREIIRMQEITSLPRMPEYVEGVINLRGKVTPVVDLRKRFRIDATEYTKETRIVVVDVGKQDVCWIGRHQDRSGAKGPVAQSEKNIELVEAPARGDDVRNTVSVEISGGGR